jgi:hypothetical protein
MILSVKLYFRVEEALKPEEVQEVVRLLQERATSVLKNRYWIKGGPKLQASSFRFKADILDWNEVQESLGIRFEEADTKLKTPKGPKAPLPKGKD